ncbi:MAG: hypothetical protein ACREID_03780 [Planctomycetota bacterium]
MDRALRAAFNAVWTPALHARVRADLERHVGAPVPFRVAESPLFLPAASWERFVRAAEEIMAELCAPPLLAAQAAEVPERYRTPGDDPLPQFAAIDFAVVREEDGSLGPRCVELQGFPSLYGFQILLADLWATALAGRPGLPARWKLFFSGLGRHRALALLRDAIVGEHDPNEVVLLDIDPAHQKTSPDFHVVRRWFGVDAVCVTALRREGDKLLREKDGRSVRVRRVYQRIVFDELERRKVPLCFDWREPLDVEWAPRPDWFYLWSKSSLLRLRHWAVPRTTRLSEIDGPPRDLERHVLKPLYSFAGAGVVVDPTPADVAAVPRDERPGWVLQERVDYAPGMESAEGHGVRAEVRMLFVRPDRDPKMTLLFDLVRLSRGKMIGVNYNKELTWTGASVALRPD